MSSRFTPTEMFEVQQFMQRHGSGARTSSPPPRSYDNSDSDSMQSFSRRELRDDSDSDDTGDNDAAFDDEDEEDRKVDVNVAALRRVARQFETPTQQRLRQLRELQHNQAVVDRLARHQRPFAPPLQYLREQVMADEVAEAQRKQLAQLKMQVEQKQRADARRRKRLQMRHPAPAAARAVQALPPAVFPGQTFAQALESLDSDDDDL